MAFSSMYVGITGLMANATGMDVISNNLANVSTTGFKKSSALFSTLISENLACGSNRMPSNAIQTSQIGLGVGVGAVQTSFLSGGFENTTEATDMAVGGNGFFGVRADDGGVYYTRAGNFRFNREGYLVDAHGNIVQGAEVDRETGLVGGVGDVALPLQDEDYEGGTTRVVKSNPRATTTVNIASNLQYGAADNYSDADDPFFAMLSAWDGTADDPLGGFNGFQTSLKVYDANGDTHALTVYYDRVDESALSNAGGGESYWEFLVAVDPSEDGRTALQGTSGAGLLACGVFTFNRYGEMTNLTAYTLTDESDPKSLSNWGLASFDGNGLPAVDMTFAGSAAQSIGLNLGMSSSNAGWSGGAATAAAVGLDVHDLGAMTDPVLDAYVSTTNYSDGSTAVYQSQDGYGEGYLQSLAVDQDGYLMGTFSNQQTEPLYRIALYRFNSEYGLKHMGNNLFGATDASGEAIEGMPKEGGRGVVYGQTLETSNVDMAEEFTKMILTQRGFQSNSKVITTSDSLLNTLISMKH